MRLLVFSALLAVASAVMATDMVDVPFFDAAGNKYLSADLRSRYEHNFEKARVLLVETPSLSSPEYQTQTKAFDSLGHEIEELQVLLVVACPIEEYKDGYHTSSDVARALASGQTKFRVRLLNPTGMVLRESSRPLAVKELRLWLKQTASK